MGYHFFTFEDEESKIYQACLLDGAKPRHCPAIYLGEARAPSTSDQSLRCTRREKQHVLL